MASFQTISNNLFVFIFNLKWQMDNRQEQKNTRGKHSIEISCFKDLNNAKGLKMVWYELSSNFVIFTQKL